MSCFDFHAMVRMSAMFLFSLILSWNPLYAEDVACPDCVVISKRNWYNSMGCPVNNPDDPPPPCVVLMPDHLLFFKIRLRVMKEDIAFYPDMRFWYDFPEFGQSGYTDVVSPWDLYPVVMENGVHAYEASFEFIFSMADTCAQFTGEIIDISVFHQLVDSRGLPYHVEAYPDLWPHSAFIMPPGGYAEVVTETKGVCCDGEPCSPVNGPNPSFLVVDKNDQEMTSQMYHLENMKDDENGRKNSSLINIETNTDSKSTINIFPNPFRSELNVEYESDMFGDAQISCYDSHGKRIEYFDMNHRVKGLNKMKINTLNWPSGIYYVQISNAEKTQTLKVLKSGS